MSRPRSAGLLFRPVPLRQSMLTNFDSCKRSYLNRSTSVSETWLKLRSFILHHERCEFYHLLWLARLPSANHLKSVGWLTIDLGALGMLLVSHSVLVLTLAIGFESHPLRHVFNGVEGATQQ